MNESRTCSLNIPRLVRQSVTYTLRRPAQPTGVRGARRLAIVRQLDAHLPFIIVSGTVGEDMTVRALKDGADDSLIKGNFARLIPAIERELREVKIRHSMRHMEARAAYALDAAGVGIWEFDLIRGELLRSQDVSVMFGLPLALSHGGLDIWTATITRCGRMLEPPQDQSECGLRQTERRRPTSERPDLAREFYGLRSRLLRRRNLSP
jgi:hypothetical protein